MKLQYYALSIIILLASACSPKLNIGYERTGMVTCDKYDKMTITLISESQAESTSKGIYFAERNAIENLLFKGIPKSNQEKPLIPNEYAAKKKHSDIFFDLIENGGYKSYVISSYTINDYSNRGVHMITEEIKIDLINLRRYLESNQVIRKFGF